jgi:translation elongation factor aEF-1 beta
MANAIVSFAIMPESPDVDIDAIKDKAFEIAKNAGAKGQMQMQVNPIAFGLKEIVILAMYEVKDGFDFETVASKMQAIEGVQSAEIKNIDLALG